MTAKMKAPLDESGAGIKQTTGTANSSPDHAAGQGVWGWPSNLRTIGVLVDLDDLGAAADLIRLVKNEQGLSSIAEWRRSCHQAPYLLVVGELHRPHGGIFGGVCRSWADAQNLFRLAAQRLGALARDGARDFSSCWMLLLNDQRRRDVEATPMLVTPFRR